MRNTFVVRPKWSVLVLGSVFFGACTAFFVYQATTSDRGLVINGVVELGADKAGVFYAVLAALSGGLVLAALLAGLHYARTPREVVMDEDRIVIPPTPLRRAPVVIRYADILTLQIEDVANQRFLHIRHRGGRGTISQQLVGERAFGEIARRLEHERRVAGAA